MIGGLIFLLGGGLTEVLIMDWNGYRLSEKAVGLGFGIPMLLAGGLLLFYQFGSAWPTKEQMEKIRAEENPADKAEIERKYPLARPLAEFREGLEDFFQAPAKTVNHPIQGYVTQVYYNRLNLQKKRLQKKGVELQIKTKRVKHDGELGEIPLIREKSYDDGKYRISLAKEQMEGEKSFWQNGKKLYYKKENQVADYTLLTAFQRGQDKVVCPSCGNATTRENLLDGCDYCKNKFTVEDLGERVQSFGFGTDYAVQYSKYRKNRDTIWKWGSILGGLPGALFALYLAGKTWLELTRDGIVFGPFVTTFGTLIAMSFLGLISAVLVIGVLWLVLYPLVQGIFGLHYIGKKWLQEVKEQEKQNEAVELAIKKKDGRFSLHGFYGNIQNKLASIVFADSPSEINAFSDCDLSEYLSRYRDVLDMEVEWMRVEDYEVINGMQEISVLAKIMLLRMDKDKIISRQEMVALRLCKTADCKTQAIAGPEITRCKSCGASILLLEGKKCRYCQSEVPLREYDWVICSFQLRH